MPRSMQDLKKELERIILADCHKNILEQLASLLTADEKLVQGVYAEGKDGNDDADILLLATTMRVISISRKRGWLASGFSPPAATFWGDIAQVTYRPGAAGLFGSPHFFHARHYSSSSMGATAEFKGNVNRASVERVVDYVKEQVARVKTRPAQTSQASVGGGDLMDQLERLARLHQSGALTDSEFNAAKRKLLA